MDVEFEFKEKNGGACVTKLLLLKECGTSYPALMIYFNLRKIVNKQILAPFLSAYFSFLLKIMNSKQNSCQKQCHSQS